MRTPVRDIIQHAALRQEVGAARQVDRTLRCLVHATLVSVLRSSEVADDPRCCTPLADFLVGDVTLHVTPSPGEFIVAKCRDNLKDGFRPMLVTLEKGVLVAEGLAENVGLHDQVDIFDIEQFVAHHLHKLQGFAADGRESAIGLFIARYNEIIQEFEADPTLMVELTTVKRLSPARRAHIKPNAGHKNFSE